MRHDERVILNLVRTGFLSIDPEGHLWRNWRIAPMTGKRIPVVPPRRAEMKGARYYVFSICLRPDKTYRAHRAMVHRIVWAYFHGNIPDGMEINHKDGDKLNNHPDNLELVTPSENVQHAYDTGLMRKLCGGKNPAAKITAKQARAIHRLYATGKFTVHQLGERFGIGHSQAWNIARGRSWNHILGRTKTNE